MGEKFWHTTFVILWVSVIICLAQPEEQAGSTGSATESKTIENNIDSKSAAPNRHHGGHGGGGNLVGAAIGAGAGLALLGAASNYGYYQPAYYDPYYSGYGYRPGHHHSGYYYRALPLQHVRPNAKPEQRTQGPVPEQSAVNGEKKNQAKTDDSTNTGAPIDQATVEAAANPTQVIFVPVIYTPNPIYPYQTYPYLNDVAQQRNEIPEDRKRINQNPSSKGVLGTVLGTTAGIVLGSALVGSAYDPYYPAPVYDPYFDPYYDPYNDDGFYRSLTGQAKNIVTPQAKALPVTPVLKKDALATRKKRSAKPLRIAGYPAPVIGYPDTVIGYEDTVVGYQDTVVGYQDTVVGYQDTVYVPGVVVPPAIVVSHDYPDYY